MKKITGEKELIFIEPVKVAFYSGFGFPGSIQWNHKVKITNKRIIISFSWFGVHSFTPALSLFYNKSDFLKFVTRFGPFGDNYISKFETGNGVILGKYVKLKIKGLLPLKIKIYTDKNKEIGEIIRKYII